MAVSNLVNLSALLDEAKCFELVRNHRWPQGVRCPGCGSAAAIRNGHDETQLHVLGLVLTVHSEHRLGPLRPIFDVLKQVIRRKE